MPKVLIFESDAAFAQQLKDELQARACQVTVVDDASAGLQAAAAERPDLILLSVELPRMNGFSVCGKLKRDNNLKSVPLVIMSTDATEETFEQHRRLRTRAEEYVHKPISFAELQKHLVSYVTLDGASGLRASGGLDAGGNGASSDEVLIDDEVDFVDDEVELDEPAVEAAAPQSPDAVSEAAQFTEQALGALLDDDQAEAGPPSSEISIDISASPEPPPVSEPAPTSTQPINASGLQQQLAIANAELEKANSRLSTLERAGAELERATARIRELERSTPDASRIAELEAQLAQAVAKAEQAEARLSEHESKLRSAPKSEDLHRLQHDLDEARAKGGATAREFLELREQINRKDKEMLELREQITSKDKELLNLREANLQQERAQADASDKLGEIEKQLVELQRSSDAAKADKEQAAKRAEDYKKKVERLSGEAEAVAAERKAERERFEEEVAVLAAQGAAAHTQHQRDLETLKGQHDAALASAVDQARSLVQGELQQAHSSALAEKDAEIAKLRSESEAALTQAREQRQAEVAKLLEEAENLQADAVATREAELRREHDNTLAALHRANEGQLNQQKNEHQAALERLLSTHEETLQRLQSEQQAKLDGLQSELQVKLDGLQSEQQAKLDGLLAEHKAALETAQGELASLRQQHESLQAAWNESKGALGQARDLLAKLNELGERQP